jgi:hypothetical protein
MNSRIKTFLTITVLATCLIFSCDKENEVSPREQKLELLTADAWITTQVLNIDGDLTATYKNFSIAFLRKHGPDFEGDYYIANGGRAFKETMGEWKFNDDLTKIILSSGAEIEFTLTEDSLVLKFFVAPVNGRVEGLSGNFTFILKRRS